MQQAHFEGEALGGEVLTGLCHGTDRPRRTGKVGGNEEGLRHLRASLFVSGCDIDLRVLGLLKMVTFAGAVTFSGAEPTKLTH